MATVMTRKAAEFWWNLPIKGKKREKFVTPSNVAFYSYDVYIPGEVNWQPTTWEDLHKERADKQRRIIANIMRPQLEIKPCYIWVFYNKPWIFHGWYVYIKILKKDFAINFRNPNKSLMLKIMNLYPCGILPMLDNFEVWAIAFEKAYHKEAFGRKKQGLKRCYCKIEERNNIIDISNDIKLLK